MTDVLLAIALFSLTYFGLYWGALLVFVWIHDARGVKSAPAVTAAGSVLVLVPSHHEGETVVDTVRTLIEQDYEDPIEIRVLVKDFADSTVRALQDAYGTKEERGDRLVLAVDQSDRRVLVVGVGQSAKHAKINAMLEETSDATFIAFLDADHRARASWIRESIETLCAQNVAGVQMRKRALAAGKLAEIWDAGLSHVGFELFNAASQRSFETVSFTGSTAVFRTRVVREYRLADCITEDTYLSYDLLLDGHRIVYDERVGSYEEVTPNIPSFVFRRRRWAAGHSHAFFKHLRSLFSAKAPTSRTLVFAIGQFFLAPVFVWLFFAAQGFYYFALFEQNARWGSLLSAALGALILTFWLSRKRSTKATDFLVCWAALLPNICLSVGLLHRFLGNESYYFITSFPFQAQFWACQIALIAGAIFTFALAWLRLRSFELRSALIFALTLPLLIFFDFLSSLLGFSDMLIGRRQWSQIDRSNEASNVEDDTLKANLTTAKESRRRGVLRYALGSLIAASALFAANETLATGQCGEPDPFLWPPFFRVPDPNAPLQISLEESAEGDVMQLLVDTRFRRITDGDIEVRIFDGEELVGLHEMSAEETRLQSQTTIDWPMDWEMRKIRVRVSGVGLSCQCEYQRARRAVELRGTRLFLNGEPFLIKGMVPTFSAPSVGLSLDEGYAQLKEAGVNSLRIYHPPSEAILEGIARHHLMLIPQPSESTWDSVDPEDNVSAQLYQRRWSDLQERVSASPNILMLNAGNELEIENRSRQRVAAIRALTERAERAYSGVTTYSTFATYLDYPVDVQGINMLDSGETYWRSALDLVASSDRPFFASEFGGFVAFFERTPSLVREWRMVRQERALRERGALGAVFFASHDNWSQAVPPGNFNDPFAAEHPDDHRGYWTTENEPKIELEMLEYLFSDVAIDVAPFAPGERTVRIRARNRRNYALEELRLNLEGESISIGTLHANGFREVEVPLDAIRRLSGYPYLRAQLRYQSHHGLEGRGVSRFTVPDPSQGPAVTGAPLFHLENAEESVSFVALMRGSARVYVPQDWRRVRVDRRDYSVERNESHAWVDIDLPAPSRPVEELEVSSDGRTWRAYEGDSPELGNIFMRFRLPQDLPPNASLVLSGLAATRVNFRTESGELFSRETHPYRETLVDLRDMDGVLSFRFRRSRPFYLTANRSPSGESVPIRLQRPTLFAPRRITITHAL